MSDEPLKLTLTNGQLAELASGLANLDGLRTKPDEFQPYLFNPDTTFAIAKNITIIADKLKVLDRAKKLLAVQYSVSEGMKVTPENAEKIGAFMNAMGELQDKEVEVVGLEKISREKLKVGNDRKKEQNPILPSVLAKLMLLLED